MFAILKQYLWVNSSNTPLTYYYQIIVWFVCSQFYIKSWNEHFLIPWFCDVFFIDTKPIYFLMFLKYILHIMHFVTIQICQYWYNNNKKYQFFLMSAPIIILRKHLFIYEILNYQVSSISRFIFKVYSLLLAFAS